MDIWWIFLGNKWHWTFCCRKLDSTLQLQQNFVLPWSSFQKFWADQGKMMNCGISLWFLPHHWCLPTKCIFVKASHETPIWLFSKLKQFKNIENHFLSLQVERPASFKELLNSSASSWQSSGDHCAWSRAILRVPWLVCLFDQRKASKHVRRNSWVKFRVFCAVETGKLGQAPQNALMFWPAFCEATTGNNSSRCSCLLQKTREFVFMCFHQLSEGKQRGEGLYHCFCLLKKDGRCITSQEPILGSSLFIVMPDERVWEMKKNVSDRIVIRREEKSWPRSLNFGPRGCGTNSFFISQDTFQSDFKELLSQEGWMRNSSGNTLMSCVSCLSYSRRCRNQTQFKSIALPFLQPMANGAFKNGSFGEDRCFAHELCVFLFCC